MSKNDLNQVWSDTLTEFPINFLNKIKKTSINKEVIFFNDKQCKIDPVMRLGVF